MKAKFISNVNPSNNGNQRLYKLDPPLEDHSYVVVSAATVWLSGPETYIFSSDEKGNIISWRELEGSQKGTLSHEKVLTDLGYTVE